MASFHEQDYSFFFFFLTKAILLCTLFEITLWGNLRENEKKILQIFESWNLSWIKKLHYTYLFVLKKVAYYLETCQGIVFGQFVSTFRQSIESLKKKNILSYKSRCIQDITTFISYWKVWKPNFKSLVKDPYWSPYNCEITFLK